MKRLKLLLLLVIGVIPSSCVHELELPDINNSSQITIIGELIAGQPMHLRAGQTVPINTQNTLQFKILQQLTIEGSDNYNNSYSFLSGVDSFTNTLFTLPFHHSANAYPGATYNFTGKHPQLASVSATVYVPKGFYCQITDTGSVENAAKKLLRFTVVFGDDALLKNYYVLEALKQIWKVTHTMYVNGDWLDIEKNRSLYDSLRNAGIPLSVKSDTLVQQKFIRLPVYTDDANSENLSIGNPYNVNKRILIEDENFQGQAYYKTHLYVQKDDFVGSLPEEKGCVIISVKSVSSDYFHFLRSYEQYDPQQGLNSFNKPVKIEGNIKGGAGMIGGVYLHSFKYCFDTWNPQD